MAVTKAAANDKPKSDTVLVREFFDCKLVDIRELMAKDAKAVKTLAEGIRSGALNY